MKKINITTPTGKSIDITGNRPYYRLQCNFHTTHEKSFMSELESRFFVKSLTFREEFTILHFTDARRENPSQVVEVLRSIIEFTLI